MSKVVVAAFIVLASLTSQSFAGSCDHSWQRAKDGSSCGGRASDQRDGGN
jgi:hypothetical protein